MKGQGIHWKSAIGDLISLSSLMGIKMKFNSKPIFLIYMIKYHSHTHWHANTCTRAASIDRRSKRKLTPNERLYSDNKEIFPNENFFYSSVQNQHSKSVGHDNRVAVKVLACIKIYLSCSVDCRYAGMDFPITQLPPLQFT